MVFLTLSKKVTGLLGPFLLRTGLAARNALSRTSTTPRADAPYLDMIALVPYAQKLISLAVYDQSLTVVSSYHSAKRRPSRMDQALDSTYDALFGSNSKQHDDMKEEKTSISELRVQVLDDHLRPALIPNDRWEDVLQWRWNVRVIKWARKEFLVSKYGPQVKEALDAYPQLRASPQLSRHPTHHMLMNLARGRVDLGRNEKQTKTMLLPSSETLIKAFGMRQWATHKDSKCLRQTTVAPIVERLGGNMVEVLEGGSNHNNTAVTNTDTNGYPERIPLDTDLSDTGMEDLLEVVTGGHVVHCGPFNAVCEEAEMYQMWTHEYVQHLGDYLLDRCRSSNEMETRIVDIGAGDGLLMHFLKEYMNENGSSSSSSNSNNNSKRRKQAPQRTKNPVLPTLIATDDGSWGIFAKAEVEQLNVQATLAKYGGGTGNDDDNTNRQQQLIVLCSWMPMGHDWTAMFRSAGVDEYILIGEADDGTCGHNWETWGNPDFSVSEDDDNDNVVVHVPSPPYQVDGYQRWDMDVLSQFQFSRFDSAVSRSCKTVSFRKKKKKNKR